MTYNSAIPQAGDLISTSQSQLLTNYGQINIKYGTSGDHYDFTNANAGEQNRHAKITLPGLPTATAPGNVLPTPGAGEGALYGLTTANVTRPFWRRDALAGAPEFSLMPVRAFASFDQTGAILGNAMNISGIVRNSAGNYRITMPANVVDSALYTILANNRSNAGAVTKSVVQLAIISALQFTFIVEKTDGTGNFDSSYNTFAVLQF